MESVPMIQHSDSSRVPSPTSFLERHIARKNGGFTAGMLSNGNRIPVTLLAALKATHGRVLFFPVAVLLRDMWECWEQRIPEFHQVHPDGSSNHCIQALNSRAYGEPLRAGARFG
jgi:hypothetical protein